MNPRAVSLMLIVLAAVAACVTQPVSPVEGLKCSVVGTVACEESSSRILTCSDAGSFEVVSDCHGPKGCVLSVADNTVSCDTSGNTVNDRCGPTSEGKVRCDPDGGHLILRCVDGGLRSIFECPDQTLCGVTDAGLSCY